MGIVIESQTFIGVAEGASGTARVWLPPGFTLTGGGAYNPGHAELASLSACCPLRDEAGRYTGWLAAASGNASVAVYAVGMRMFSDGVPLPIEQQVFCASSALVADPGVSVRLGDGWIGTGGGAQDNHASASAIQALVSNTGRGRTCNHPLLGADGQIVGWSASGKSRDGALGARVSAYVVGIRTPPGIELDAATLAAFLRPALPAHSALSALPGPGAGAGAETGGVPGQPASVGTRLAECRPVNAA